MLRVGGKPSSDTVNGMTRWTRPVICIVSGIGRLLLIQASYEAT